MDSVTIFIPFGTTLENKLINKTMTILHIIILLYHEYNLVLHDRKVDIHCYPFFFALFFTPTINELHIEL